MIPDPGSPGAPSATVGGQAGDESAVDGAGPTTIPRDRHSVSRKRINPHALKVLYRLHNAGFQAHLVGGGVRDLLLDLEPKDFDIATDATPEEVRSLFRNCRLIGRRFRLAHVVFGREVVEVATFRSDHRATADDADDADVHARGRILRDNVFGTIEEDAFRRDFTVNALYYDISRFAVLDYTGGMADLAARRLRLIGDPAVRYREDPVRMLRAARFAAKLGFDIDVGTAAPIADLGALLRDIPPSRLFEEVLKLFQAGHAARSLEQLRRNDLLQYLFPSTDIALKSGDEHYERLLDRALENTDRRLGEGKPVTPAFLYAVLLWPPVTAKSAALAADGDPPVMAMQRAASRTIEEQQGFTSLPKRFAGPVREIWLLQAKLEQYRRKRARHVLGHPRLRAAWDFLCLRRDAGEDLAAACDWWQQAMEADAAGEAAPERSAPVDAVDPPTAEGAPGPRRRRRRGGRRRPGSGRTKNGGSGGSDPGGAV